MKTYVWTEWTNSFPPEHEGHFDGYKSSDLLVDGEWTGSVMRQHRRSFTAFPIGGGHHSHIESEDTAKAIVEKAAGREIEVPLDHRQLLWSLRENPRALGERDVRVLLDITQSAEEDSEAMRELARSYMKRMDERIADKAKECQANERLREACRLLSNYEEMLTAGGKDFIGLTGGPSLNEKTRAFLAAIRAEAVRGGG